LTFLDHPQGEGLKATFQVEGDTLTWESIHGSCAGLECQLYKNSKNRERSSLSGEIHLDAEQLLKLFPEEMQEKLKGFRFGSGYHYKGELSWNRTIPAGFECEGTFGGAEFEFMGYTLHHLEGSIRGSPEHIVLSNLKIEDEAGAIQIKKVELNKAEEWHLFIPLIQMQTLQPSLMRKVGIAAQIAKPFVIRQFSISDISGILSKKESFKGTGTLFFTNQYKKEATLFDTPLELIKNIGLDPGILTPVQGEIELELHGDKFYFTALRNAFSDGKRSEFFLDFDHELSYIDLDGKMHIDLKMRQDVMLKVTEPFTLTIRGTLEKPRYGLQF
jgi:hypothetical protein